MTAAGAGSPAALDVLLVGDFRCGDAGAAGSGALAAALAAAGYRVGAVQWFGAAAAEPTRMDPGWSGLAAHGVRRVAVSAASAARLVLATDLRLFLHRARAPLAVAAERRLVIAPRPFASDPVAAAEVLANADEALGGPVAVAPAAPPLRAALEMLLPRRGLEPEDWPPVVPPGAAPALAAARASRPILGCFRASPARGWPANAEALRRVLPAHALVGLRLRAAPAGAVAELAGGPAPVEFWTAEDDLAAFLCGLDLIACLDRPEDDPWPEEVLAALSAGVVPLLPPGYRPMFLSAAAYARPGEVADTAVDLFGNPELMADLRLAGRELIERQLAPGAAAARVAALIGPPAALRPVARPALRPAATVLSLSTNGVGMGHLARQLAIANRLEPHLLPVFLGFSSAVAVVRQFGYPAEYLPYHLGPGLNPAHWNGWLAEALDAACRFYRPRVFLLDANMPFQGVEALGARHPGLPMIWVRRAMWGADRDLEAIERAAMFDLVIEPGELAGPYDRGPTVAARELVRRVAPIRLVDPDDQLPRGSAAAEIGIEADTLNVLVLAGAQNNFEARAFWTAVMDELKAWPRTRVVIAEWAMADRSGGWPGWALRRRGFPFARWFAAFDFAVAQAGYNSFAELTGLGLPAVFVPNENPLMDRQDLRARYADRNGLGLHLPVAEIGRIPAVLGQMRDPARRARFRTRLAALPAANGATEAAALVAAWAEGGLAHRADAWE